METATALASKELIEKRTKYPIFSGKALISKISPKCETMLCVRVDEIEVAMPRQLRIRDGKLMDITDPVTPREVAETEQYHIGWGSTIIQ